MKRTEETHAPSTEVASTPSADVSITPPPRPQAVPAAAPASVVADPTAHLHEVVVYASAGLVGFLGPRKNDPKTRFDSYQALFSALVALAVYGLMGLLGGVFVQTVQPLFVVAAVGGAGYVLWTVYQGKPVDIPFISSAARKQAAETKPPGQGPDPA